MQRAATKKWINLFNCFAGISSSFRCLPSDSHHLYHPFHLTLHLHYCVFHSM